MEKVAWYQLAAALWINSIANLDDPVSGLAHDENVVIFSIKMLSFRTDRFWMISIIVLELFP